MRVFLLEDDPNRVAGFESALDGHTLDAAIDVEAAKALFTPPYDLILLDHDLGGEVFVSSEHDNTGAAFARHLANTYQEPVGEVVVHSWNPDGARNMVQTLRAAGWVVIASQFSGSLLNSLRQSVAREEAQS